jgi:hypothetical protein
LGLGLTAAVGLAVVLRPEPRQHLVLPDGREVTILKVTYGARHKCVFGPGWLRAVAWVLPEKWVRQQGGGTSKYQTGPDTLMVWAQWEHVSVTNQPATVATLGEPAAESAQVYATAWGGPSPSRAITGWPFPNFPRRQQELILRLYDVRPTTPVQPAASLALTNPARCKRSPWTPQPLPQTRAVGEFTLALTQWAISELSLTGQVSAIKLRFASANGGLDALKPSRLDVSDSSGNLWSYPLAWQTPTFERTGELLVKQPLWAQEQAYRLRFEFLQPTGSNLIHHLRGVPVPTAGSPPAVALLPSDGNVRVERVYRPGPAGSPSPVEVVLTMLRGPLQLLSVADQSGEQLPWREMGLAAQDQRGFYVGASAQAQSLDFAFEVLRSHWVEFLVPPPEPHPPAQPSPPAVGID